MAVAGAPLAVGRTFAPATVGVGIRTDAEGGFQFIVYDGLSDIASASYSDLQNPERKELVVRSVCSSHPRLKRRCKLVLTSP